MPSMKHKVLKITTTGIFQVENPDKPNNTDRPANIELNRAVLEKMLPQFAGRPLDSWICPYVSSNLRWVPSSNPVIETL